VIDIGRTGVVGNGSAVYCSNQVASEPTVFFGQQDNYAPPPYPGLSTGFCSQCGVARQGLTAKFCSSCGQLFNKY
jgi:hypothetical protein